MHKDAYSSIFYKGKIWSNITSTLEYDTDIKQNDVDPCGLTIFQKYC